MARGCARFADQIEREDELDADITLARAWGALGAVERGPEGRGEGLELRAVEIGVEGELADLADEPRPVLDSSSMF
jgi:hypothetical protein